MGRGACDTTCDYRDLLPIMREARQAVRSVGLVVADNDHISSGAGGQKKKTVRVGKKDGAGGLRRDRCGVG